MGAHCPLCNRTRVHTSRYTSDSAIHAHHPNRMLWSSVSLARASPENRTGETISFNDIFQTYFDRQTPVPHSDADYREPRLCGDE